jgi:ribosomal protein S18 acetylase RimI-like enzyme
MRLSQITDADFNGAMAEFFEAEEFLASCYRARGRMDNWSHCRFEDFLFGGNARRALSDPSFFARNMHIWRKNGAIAGLAVAERGEAVTLQVHPDHRDLEEDMVLWARKRHSHAGAAGIMCNDFDFHHKELLKRHGFAFAEESGITRRFDTRMTPINAPLAEGYELLTFREMNDPASYVEAVRAAFGRETLDMQWLRSKQQAPSISEDWIIIAALNGKCAAFCDVRISWRDRCAEIDPVGTHPQHQRRGLARACLVEAMIRLRRAEIFDVYIGSAAEPAPSNRLYDSLLPTEKWKEETWLQRS